MFIKEPVLGMRDLLPGEMEVREYLFRKLKCAYSSFGYSLIETPCIEHIENLTNNQGGENEKLIFKILKRGEKLSEALVSKNPDDIIDAALRYDLTVPLARYYANNSGKLALPFKAMQIGSAWRADRPQRGRFRQFTQCDIDIIGDATINAEIELIYVTSMFLESIGVGGCTVMLNDRRLLRAMAEISGFHENQFSKIFITLDKYDKIGIDGIRKELLSCDYADEAVETYITLLMEIMNAENRLDYCLRKFKEILNPDVVKNIDEIINSVNAISNGRFILEFDPSLVRGMTYYTGVIFEIKSDDFEGASIAGGGRYDEMIGGFTGQSICACGFSIGFERIIALLNNRTDMELNINKKICVLYDKSFDVASVTRLQKKCADARATGKQILIQQMKKNMKNQIKTLEEEHYSFFIKIRNTEEIDTIDFANL